MLVSGTKPFRASGHGNPDGRERVHRHDRAPRRALCDRHDRAAVPEPAMSIAVADIAEPREDQRRRWSPLAVGRAAAGLAANSPNAAPAPIPKRRCSFVITPNRTNNLSEWNILSN